MLEIGKRPVLLVEVKADSPLRRGGWVGDNREDPDAARQSPIGLLDDAQAAIVLLSRMTRAPDRFQRKTSANGLHQRHCQWHRVWNWLHRKTADGDGNDKNRDVIWQVLGKQLAILLKEQNMASGFMMSEPNLRAC